LKPETTAQPNELDASDLTASHIGERAIGRKTLIPGSEVNEVVVGTSTGKELAQEEGQVA
jgi:hypothetical protein